MNQQYYEKTIPLLQLYAPLKSMVWSARKAPGTSLHPIHVRCAQRYPRTAFICVSSISESPILEVECLQRYNNLTCYDVWTNLWLSWSLVNLLHRLNFVGEDQLHLIGRLLQVKIMHK